MPPINPQQLLNALDPLLTDKGGIKGSEEASRITRLMSDATKLVSKCMYLNILRVTTSPEALVKFMSNGGWDTLNNWLDNARNTSNDPLVGELLEVFLNLPVTVLLLKQNSTAKTIKQLRKAENEKIQKLSAQLVDRWTKTIRDQNNADNESEEKRKKNKYKDKEKERDKSEKEKERDKSEREKERDKSDKEKERDKSDKEKERDKSDKEKEKDRKERERESDKKRDKERESKNHHSDKDRKDKNRQRDKDKERDRHKDKEKSRSSSSSKIEIKESSSIKNQTTSESSSTSKNKNSSISSSAKVMPNLDAPSSNYTGTGTDPASSNNNQGSADQGKEEESRRRPKTVKQFGGKFRSLGLSDDEGDADDEPIKKKIEKPTAPLKRTTVEKGEDMAGEKKPRLHLSMPPLNPTTGDGSSASTTPPEVTHGRIKIIPPPKKAPAHEIHESNVFMDALQQSSSTYAYGALKRKKKLTSPSPVNTNTQPSLLASTIPSGTSPPPTSATSPPALIQNQEGDATSPPLLSPTTAMAQRLPSVPSFYRDTLDDLPDASEAVKSKSEDKEEESEEKEQSPPHLESMEIDNREQDKGEEMDTMEENDWSSSGPPLLNDETTKEPIIVERSAKKKTVTWAADTVLEEVFYFELDETERENVNRPRSFNQMKKEEMILDRRAFDAAKRLINDNMVEVLQWRTPKPFDDPIVVVEAGCNSKEKEIQMEREKGVLCALYFNKVPDTPKEPDPDIPGEQADTKNIPLEDENGSCTEYEHTYNQTDPSSLPYDPEFDLPLPNQGQSGPGMGPVPGNNLMNNGGMSGNINTMGMNLPPAINHLLQTLQQQAQETRDPLMANLQNMLSNVLQTTNPQDGNMLMERVLNTLEQFRNQIPGLSNLIDSIANGSMDNVNMSSGPRPFLNQQGPPGPPGPMGAPRHSLLGPHPPRFNMMGGGGGGGGSGMRPPHPPMQGPGGPMMPGGGGGNPNFYMGKPGGPGPGRPNMDKMRMGGPPNQWHGGRGGGGGGGGRRHFNKRGRSQICQHYINKGCKYGDSCGFIHPANGPNS